MHCVVQRRPDGLGSNHNAKIFAIGRGEVDIAPGTPGAAVLPELGPEPTDLVLSRWHGVGPMGGTDLDAVLRNLEVSTIVVVGVSLNIAIPNVVMDAVNAGYRVVLPKRCRGRNTGRVRCCHDRQHAVAARDYHHDRRSASAMETAVTDTAPKVQGGFPDVRPAEHAPPGLDRFVSAMRRLQDLTVSTNPESSTWITAAQHVESACTLLDGHQAPEGVAPAGRVLELPGLGHPMLPPWTLTESGPDGVTMQGHFTRSHVGGNNAVHGGMIPLFYDWLFGHGGVDAAGCRANAHRLPARRLPQHHSDRRTADRSRAASPTIDGRKIFISATMTAADDTLLSEANGLMVRLLPHQP